MKSNARTVGSVIPPRPTRIPAAERPKGTIASPMIVAAIIVAGLYLARDILIPIAIAVLLSFVLAPVVQALRRLRLGRLFAVVIAVLVASGIIAALSTVIGVQVSDLAADVPRYERTIERKIEGVKEGPVGAAMRYLANVNRALHESGDGEEKPKDSEPKAKTEAKTEPSPPPPVLVELKNRPPSSLELARTVLSPVVQPLATAGIVVVVLLFVLMQREDLRDRLIRLAGSSDLHRTTVAMDDAARRLSRYFIGQLALNTSFGIIIGAGLWLIGVPNPILWGIFSALMRFVPYIGAFLSAVFPLALAAAVDPGWSMVIATLILFGIVEPIVGHVVEPLVYGHSTGLSPFAVVISALFWTWLWGPVGLLLSTPLTVCLVVLGRHVDALEFLDVLFSDRPALTPVENFYQRMLADDPEEAQEHAETILRGCSLSSYYDDVVMKGLELAARDAARGVLTAEQRSDIRSSITGLIEELEDRDDARPVPRSGRRLLPRKKEEREACDPEPTGSGGPEPEELPEAWRHEGAVLCVSGRGFLDEPAAAILAQLLRKRGLGSRTVGFSELARARIDDFEAGPVRMVCVVSLAIGDEPGHLRRLVARLRRKLPEARIAVGLWRIDEDGAQDESPRIEVAADENVTSLGDAIESVLTAAANARSGSGPVRESAAPARLALPEPA